MCNKYERGHGTAEKLNFQVSIESNKAVSKAIDKEKNIIRISKARLRLTHSKTKGCMDIHINSLLLLLIP